MSFPSNFPFYAAQRPHTVLHPAPKSAATPRHRSPWSVQEDCRRLTLPDGSVDAVVTDVPFGNRNRLIWATGRGWDERGGEGGLSKGGNAVERGGRVAHAHSVGFSMQS